jgi:hypothetical protein
MCLCASFSKDTYLLPLSHFPKRRSLPSPFVYVRILKICNAWIATLHLYFLMISVKLTTSEAIAIAGSIWQNNSPSLQFASFWCPYLFCNSILITEVRHFFLSWSELLMSFPTNYLENMGKQVGKKVLAD